MSEGLLERARDGRTSGAVLKASLSNLRARVGNALVFVFEGSDDVGPYQHWIMRSKPHLSYSPLVASGKGQLLDLRRRLKSDTTGLASGVYYFVDRDFDGLRGQDEGGDIYCLRCYSLENHLVADNVLSGILVAHFKCFNEDDDRGPIRREFAARIGEFLAAMHQANTRVHVAARLSISGRGIDERIVRYVEIGLTEIRKKYDSDELARLIPLSREPSDAELAALGDVELASSGHENCRGKFVWSMFVKWLELLALDRREERPVLFSRSASVSFSTVAFSLTHAACFAMPPPGLHDFLDQLVSAEVAVA